MNVAKAKKTAIYPYHCDVIPIALYLENLNPQYQIKSLVVTPGSKSSGTDAGLLYSQPEMGIIVTDDIMDAINGCECLIIMDGSYSDRFRQTIIQHIEEALRKNKEVICTLSLSKDELKSIQMLAKDNPAASFTSEPDDSDKENEITDTYQKLYSPKAPVIFVSELVSGLDAFSVTLGLTDFLRRKGYKTVTLAEKSWSALLNIIPIPDYMRLHDMDERTKIYAFNRLIKQLDKKENPKVFVIQLPGAIMKFNDVLTAGFGIIPYLISQAVQADTLVLCASCDQMNADFYEELSERLEHLLGTGISSIHLSNRHINVSGSMAAREFSFLRIEHQKVDVEVIRLNQSSRIPFYNCLNLIEHEEMCDQLISELEG